MENLSTNLTSKQIFANDKVLESNQTVTPNFSPHFTLPSNPASAVLQSIRFSGLIYRDQIVNETGLSAATVNRQVAALLESNLIKERTDNQPIGIVGRPRMPLEINASGPLVLGLYIGSKVTTMVVYDTLIRMVGSIAIPNIEQDPNATLNNITDSAIKFMTRWKNRTFLRLGVAIAGSIDDKGNVSYPTLRWSNVPVARILSSKLGLRVTIATHVEAMAAAELQHMSPTEANDTTLYFYARESVGTSLIVGGKVRKAKSGHTNIGNMPYALLPNVSEDQPTLLDPQNTGRLEDAVSDSSIFNAAIKHGVNVQTFEQLVKAFQTGNQTVVTIFEQRAKLLAGAISLVSDIINPDRIVLGGQTFTDVPSLLPLVAKEVATRTFGARHPIHITAAKNYVQHRAAGAAALDRLFYDPIAEMSAVKTKKSL